MKLFSHINRHIKRKIKFFLFISSFFFTNCTKPSSQWVYDEIQSDSPSALLSFFPTNKFNGLELKFLTGNFGTIGYLNTTTGNFTNSEITYVIDNQRYTAKAQLLAGGQTLLLPETLTKQFLTALKEHKTCAILVSPFYCKLEGEECTALLDKFIQQAS